MTASRTAVDATIAADTTVRPRWHEDPGSKAIIGLVAFLVVYAGWQIFRWGGPGAQQTIGDIAFWPLNTTVAVLAFRVTRTRMIDARLRRAWGLIGLGLVAYLLGDVVQLVYESVLHELPYPSVADACYLLFYPLVFVGIMQFPRERHSRSVLIRVGLDASTTVIAGASIVWYLVLGPATASGGRNLDLLVSIAYPSGDLVLILALSALAVRTRRVLGSWSLYLLVGSLLLYIISDIIYARLSIADAYSGGDLVDMGWMFAMALIGASANEQFRVAKRGLSPTEARHADGGFAFLPYVATAVTFVMMIVSLGVEGRLATGEVTLLGAVVIVVLARLHWSSLQTRMTERQFRALVEDVTDDILIIGADGTVTYMSPSLARVLGCDTAGSAVDDSWRQALPADERARLDATTEGLIPHPGASIELETLLHAADGTTRTLSGAATNLLADRAVRGIVIVFHDITERVEMERELQRQALHDSLTGLPNRALIFDRLSQMLASSGRRFSRVAALFIDLDNFKDVNDRLGHGVGDELLIGVAARLSSVMRREDTVGRLGGDEFIVLAEQSGASNSAVLIAQRILDIFAEPFVLDSAPDLALSVRASIGIAIGTSAEPDDLLRNADVALYRAKAAGRNQYVAFDSEMDHLSDGRLQLGIDLRDAFRCGQFFLVYQPIIDLTTMQMYGVEALIRWNRPGHGVVEPNEFIPLLEQDGLILDVGGWVLREACAQGAAWAAAGTDLTVSVNTSALQLIAGDFVDRVRDALHTSGLAPQHLVVEVTESVLMSEPAQTVTVLQALHALGVRIAIDDFGTGYSSLSYLRQFPIDALKIDQSFVTDMEHSKAAATLVRTLVGLGKELGITTTAEGIEDIGQLAALQIEQCDSGQGFLIAPPMSAADVTAFETKWRATNSPPSAMRPPAAAETGLSV